MSTLHAEIAEQATDIPTRPAAASLAPLAKTYRLASAIASFVVSFVLVGGVALSFAFGDNDRVLAGEPVASSVA